MMQELEGEACGEKFYKNASEDDVNFMVCSYWALGYRMGANLFIFAFRFE